MTYMMIESLDYKAQIKNDFDKGYEDGLKHDKAEQGKTALYYDGFALGFKTKGK